jgi:hypothetical protein
MIALACVLALILGPWGTPARAADFTSDLAAKCKGEAAFAIGACACVGRNRLAAGQSEAEVLAAFYAAPIEATDAERWIVERVLTGYWPCEPRLWFMFSLDDVWRLGLAKADALQVVARGGRQVLFYAEAALVNG